MNSRVLGSILAIIFLVAWPLWMGWRNRRTALDSAADHYSLPRLLLASILTIFLELAIIRWLSVEVRIFAYMKNLALLLCFLGFGLGCALAGTRKRWFSAATALLVLVAIVRNPWVGRSGLENLSQTLGASRDLAVWGTGFVANWEAFLGAALLTGVLLWLVTQIFVPLGQEVSHQMDLATSSLAAYSWNLVGNLVGIAAFFLAAWASLPPTVWLAAGFVGFALLQTTMERRLVFSVFLLPAVLLLHDPVTPAHFALWTPYQQIEVERQRFSNGEPSLIVINVNHTTYQIVVDLSAAFLARHPDLLKEAADENPYNLPFRFSQPNPRVLIVGSGTGNDVAAALRNGSERVDAVEIDPGILKLGRQEHPERPYQSANVVTHVTDARAFMRRTRDRYDLILFGLLDSHTQFSDYSNMRIDNFVYTSESFREARDLLTPDGVLFIKFQVDHPWLGKRIAELLSQTFGKPPVVFLAGSSYSPGATCFVVSASDRVQARLQADRRLAQLAELNRSPFLTSAEVPVTTDDWPYLYQEGRGIPRTFIAVAVLVMLLAIGLFFRVPLRQGGVRFAFFFAMGAGFLLLETQVISRLALYFGTTWKVNGIAIAALLTTLVVANTITETHPPKTRRWLWLGLIAGLALAYGIPFHQIPGSTAMQGTILAVVFTIPVFFAGLLFAGEFRVVAARSAALKANMLGAVAGGLLENVSLVTGMRALLLIAMGCYLIAMLGVVRSRD